MKENKNKEVNIGTLQYLEPFIKNLLDKPEIWKTLDVDYFPPRVERIYTDFNGYRIFLHYIHKTELSCLYHKHRWAAAFKQVCGSYEMGLTYSEDEITSDEAYKLPDLGKFIINAGSYYEMTQTDALHYVKPISDFSCSLMITKDLYPESVFRKETLDKKLEPLSEERKKSILSIFKTQL